MEGKKQTPENWVAITGGWKFEDNAVIYLGPLDTNNPFPHGIALCNIRFRNGIIKSKIRFPEELRDSTGEIVFGYNAESREYLAGGLGSFSYFSDIMEYRPNSGWKALGAAGSNQNIVIGREYEVEMRMHGQKVRLFVDGIKVVEHQIPRPLSGDQVGYYAWGPGPVEFRSMIVDAARPKVFVVMQFGDPYDGLYTDVIKPVADEMGLYAFRGDDVYKPGIILQDIIRDIVEAEIIIAEITPRNANVFYELGFAHALGKTTILLAERGNELPFDIRSYRCIFYDNTIKGKKSVEEHLRKHLLNIVQEL